MEKSWNSVGHGKSHGKPKFGQIYFVDFVELRALKEFLNLCNTDLTTNNKGLSYETLI